MKDPRIDDRRIAVICGHPDPTPSRFCRALASAYAEGAIAGGHEIKSLDIADMQIPMLRAAETWRASSTEPDILAAQETITWANHLVVIYPLWLGDMPALLKSFFEQVSAGGAIIELGPGDGSASSGANRRASWSPWACRRRFIAGSFSRIH
ncbi:NAD(P)H-dependent oxidoreductase [Terrarubrum flagellatum]|uniref:NAD(P)H-dependent oxidoreductase n=1 Tax=Terrirubrum flagellatum TaxID=2895980 RepID=UPI003144F2EF